MATAPLVGVAPRHPPPQFSKLLEDVLLSSVCLFVYGNTEQKEVHSLLE